MNARLLLTLVLGTMIVLLVSACAGIGAPSGDPLKGTSWRLVTIGGANLVPGTEITATFEDGQVGGSACNSYGGPYMARGNELAVGELVRTLMACEEPEGIMEQEDAYLDMLGEAKSFSLSGQELRIVSPGGGTLVFAQD